MDELFPIIESPSPTLNTSSPPSPSHQHKQQQQQHLSTTTTRINIDEKTKQNKQIIKVESSSTSSNNTTSIAPKKVVIVSSGSISRESKIYKLKSRIAWDYCTHLLSPPLINIGGLNIDKCDSEIVIEEKKQIYAKKVAKREEEIAKREPELLKELDKIIKRIRDAKPDYKGNSVSYAQLATTASIGNFYCDRCRNRNPNNFISDSKLGDTICLGKDGQGCGNVVQDHNMSSGAAKRSFASDEEDKRYFGPAPDQLMSDSWNMKTSIGLSTSGVKDPLYKKLLQTHQIVEMNLSSIGIEDRRTKELYRDSQKNKAFEMMQTMVDSLNLHQSVLVKAKEEFSHFRDVREQLQQYEGVLSACLVIAYEELSLYTENLERKEFEYTGPRLLNAGTVSLADVLDIKADPNDPAQSTLTNIVMGKWTENQLKEWLVAVSNSDRDISNDGIDPRIELILNHIKKNIDRDISNNNNNNNENKDYKESNNNKNGNSSSNLLTKKRNYSSALFSSSMFGSVTMKGRKKVPSKPAITNDNTSTINDIASYGQYFVKLNFSEIQSKESYDFSLFREARKRRSKFEFSHYEANLLREQDRYINKDSSNIELLSASRKNIEPSSCLEDVVSNTNTIDNTIVDTNNIADDFENFLATPSQLEFSTNRNTMRTSLSKSNINSNSSIGLNKKHTSSDILNNNSIKIDNIYNKPLTKKPKFVVKMTSED